MKKHGLLIVFIILGIGAIVGISVATVPSSAGNSVQGAMVDERLPDLLPYPEEEVKDTPKSMKLPVYSWMLPDKDMVYRIADIQLPPDYQRIPVEPGSFAEWLRYLPLKPKGSQVYLYNGKLKDNQDAHYAVIDMDVGNKDLQQCADAIMRLKAEYHYSKSQFSKIRFYFVSGFDALYSKWMSGYGIKVSGNNVQWIESSSAGKGYKSFKLYMQTVFNYASTISLKRMLVPVDKPANLRIGDLFIKSGSPGHTIIVVDMAKNAAGQVIFMLAQSYMPAQEMHVLKNPSGAYGGLPWYSTEFGSTLVTPEWEFGADQIMRFKE
jgi:hypothetical protein